VDVWLLINNGSSKSRHCGRASVAQQIFSISRKRWRATPSNMVAGDGAGDVSENIRTPFNASHDAAAIA